MILKYDIKKYLKDNSIQQTRLARRLGMSKQLLYYYINTEEVSAIMINTLSELLKIAPSKVLNDLNNNYIKTKI